MPPLNTTSPKVSVIVPNYNHARFLEKRLQSVLDQSFGDFEILYLDDASTDDSARVFAPFAANSRIRVILNEHNSGVPFKQWNKGVRAARGEFIWIAEADDYADASLLETLMDVLERNPQVGLAFCQSWVVDETDRVVELEHLGWHIDPERWSRDFVMPGRDYVRQYLTQDNTIPNASAVVFRKAVYESAGYANETLRLTGDWMTWYQMLQRADIAFVARPLNFFRTHSGSVRANSTRTGVAAQERYVLAHRMLRDLRLSPQQLEAVRHASMNVWRQALFAPAPYKEWRRHLRIYRSARRLDPRVHLRLIRHIGYGLLQNSRFFEPVRAFGRKVWKVLVKATS